MWPSYSNAVGMVNRPLAQLLPPEFNIRQEEFPALPGSRNPRPQSASLFPKMWTSAHAGFDPRLTAEQQNRWIQVYPNGLLTNVPSSMVSDQFGIAGLFAFIRAVDTNSKLAIIAPGPDMTKLGPNLYAKEPIHTSFQSPFADRPSRPQDIDFYVPNEYRLKGFLQRKLPPIDIHWYEEGLLFFLFYMYPGEKLQLQAAFKLYDGNWRYHKEQRVWLKRKPDMKLMHKTQSWEQGTYIFFDATKWQKVTRENFLVEYHKLEGPPHLPEDGLPLPTCFPH